MIPLLEAVTAAVVVQAFGVSCVLLLMRGRQLPYALASGLLWGLALHVFLGLAGMGVALTLGILPAYPPQTIATVTALAALTAVAAVAWRASAWEISRRRLLAGYLGSAACAAAAVAAAVHWNLAVVTRDSMSYVQRGLELARISDPQHLELAFVYARGIFGPLLHAPTAVSSFQYFYFLSPVAGVALLATLTMVFCRSSTELGCSKPATWMAAFLGLAWLLTCYMMLFQLFLVHVNLFAAAYLLLFFHAAWMSLMSREERWLVAAGVALFAFQLIRVEGALFAGALLILLVLERAADGRRGLAWPAGLALPGIVWSLGLAALVDTSSRIATVPRLLAMAALLAASPCVALLAGREPLARHASRLPAGFVACLAVAFPLLLLTDPELLLRRTGNLVKNLLFAGQWSTAWLLPMAFVAAMPLLGRFPHARFLVCGIACYLLTMMDLGVVAAWRVGWHDSGNRMLTHILPVVVWVIQLSCVAASARADGPRQPAAN